MKLDTKRPYGVISGDHYGAVYEQDGRVFDRNEEEIVIAADEVDNEQQESAPAPKAAKQKTVKVAGKRGGRPAKSAPAAKPPVVEKAPKATSAIDEQLAAQIGG